VLICTLQVSLMTRFWTRRSFVAVGSSFFFLVLFLFLMSEATYQFTWVGVQVRANQRACAPQPYIFVRSVSVADLSPSLAVLTEQLSS
jgi:protein-S-isoprenylcysteine O-methyltransferase Ste14